MSLVVIDLSPKVAAHIAEALRLYREKEGPRNGFALPREIAELENLMVLKAREGHSGSTLDSTCVRPQPVPMDAPTITYATASRITGYSVSTIKRRITDGVLTPVRHGGRARLLRADVENLNRQPTKAAS